MEQRGFQHQALIYEGDDEYLEGVMSFVVEALIAGEPLLVAGGAAQGELIASELGPDADRVLFVDMQTVGRNPAAIIPLWREFVDDHSGLPVRGISEPAWADRSRAELEECHRHEGLLNVAFARASTWNLLCPYDAESLDDPMLERAAFSHSRISRQGRIEKSACFEPNPDCMAGDLPPPAARPDDFSFGPNDLGAVRRRVALAAERAGLGPRAGGDFVTAASELAANSVAHGGGTGTLRLWREEDDLLAEVEDGGLIDEPLAGRLRPHVSQEGGRGLWLANQLCDLVQIRSGKNGTKVRLHVPAHEGVLV